VVEVSGLVGDEGVGVLAGGLTEAEGAVVEPAAPLVVSLPAVLLGEVLGAVVAALAVPPVAAPDHQSWEARCFGEAFR
jgi:hypothetical protein